MADPATIVSPQITDAVTSTNVKTLGDTPAFNMALVYSAFSDVAQKGMQQQTFIKGQQDSINLAVTANANNLMATVPTASTAQAVKEIIAATNQSKSVVATALQAIMD